jgi:hypothetical protein
MAYKGFHLIKNNVILETDLSPLAVWPKWICSNRQVVSSLSKPYSNHEVKVTSYYLQGLF